MVKAAELNLAPKDRDTLYLLALLPAGTYMLERPSWWQLWQPLYRSRLTVDRAGSYVRLRYTQRSYFVVGDCTTLFVHITGRLSGFIDDKHLVPVFSSGMLPPQERAAWVAALSFAQRLHKLALDAGLTWGN